LAASAVAVEYTTAFAGIPLAVFVAVRARSQPVAMASATASALVPIGLLALYHARVFGSPFTTGYHRAVDPGFAETHGHGLLGLGLPTANSLYEHLLSPWGGLLPWAILFLVGVSGLVALARTEDESGVAARVELSIAVILFVVLLGLEQSGGWRVGPRYLVAALPFVTRGLCHVLDRPATRPVALALACVATFSLVTNLLAGSLFPHLVPEGNPLADLLAPLLLAGRSAHGLPVLLLIVIGLLGSSWLLARTNALARPIDIALGAALGLGGVVLLASFPSSTGPANLAAIESIWEPEGGVSPKSRAIPRADDSLTR
jgi:hypothetical protein